MKTPVIDTPDIAAPMEKSGRAMPGALPTTTREISHYIE